MKLAALLCAALGASGFGDGGLVPAPAQSSPNLEFRGGVPLLPVRLMERAEMVTFSSRGRLRLQVSADVEKQIEGPEGARWTVRRSEGTAARVLAQIQLAEFTQNDKAGLEAAKKEWATHDVPVKTHLLGRLFGIAGKVIDNRRTLLLVDAPPEAPQRLEAQQTEILAKYGVRTTLFETTAQPSTVNLEILSSSGESLARGVRGVTIESISGAPIEVQKVEHDVGYDAHGFEDRAYRGTIRLVADRFGSIAVVNAVTVEELLKGLVPSEIFPKAHAEALKAQAVTGRSEVLAKVGLKHLVDPYLLCTEQHCAVYRGTGGETPATSAAVDATRGEGLFSKQGHLIDATYSAICGGHTENNESVWGGQPNPHLRGVPDVIGTPKVSVGVKDVAGFLKTETAHACKVASLTQLSRYRWQKRFSAQALDQKVESLGVGTVYAMTITERGVSGRARLLSISGDRGAAVVRSELSIRKLFGMLNSALFEISVQKNPKGKPLEWIFTGGGWGHGAGMCQMGAIGRAEAGQKYRDILRHYYSGAEVAPIY